MYKQIEIKQKENKALCVAPWIYFYAGYKGKVQACCVSGITYGNIYEDSLKDLWRNKRIENIRNKFLAGEQDKRCSYCYKLEESGRISLRKELNAKYRAELEDIVQGDYNTDVPVYYDIRFSNLCNLRCRTCWHGASSKWFEDSVLLGNNADKNAIIQHIPKDFFDENLDEIITNSREFFFAGGEPLITEEVYQLLVRLIENQNTDVLLRFNTNLTHLKFGKYDILQLLAAFSNVEIQISLDHIAGKAEIIRKDLKWNSFLKNYFKMKNILPNVKIIIHPAISVLNVYDWPEIELFLMNEMHVHTNDISLNFLLRPDYYCIQNIPKPKKEKIDLRFKQYGLTAQSIEILDFLNVEAVDLSHKALQATKHLDTIRKEDSKEILGWLIA